MKAVLVVVALVCIGSAFASNLKPLAAEEYQFLFKSWMNQHTKTYQSTSEFETRYSIWKANLDKIRHHQANAHKTHTMAMNKFGDLTQQEFKELFCTLAPISNQFMRSKNVAVLPTSDLPDSVDWVAAKKVTGVKDQGQCGSCWSFSATGSIEGGYAIDNNVDATITVSEQELVDCSTPQGNQGCNGGLMDQAFEFVIANGGLCTEADYPYKAVDGTCPNPLTCKSALSIGAFVDVTVNSEDQLQAAVATRPVSVAVDAETWQFYSGGVLTSSCGTSLDHGVLAAGYGTDNGQAYWLVKNSWGASWGESGYIRLARGSGSGQPGQCGICMAASYPTGVKAVSGKRHHKHH